MPPRSATARCPSPFFLGELDAALERQGCFFVRFMDDVLVLAPTRWKLRRAARTVNQILKALGLEKHPGKTYIGLSRKGFEFLGYHFGPGGRAARLGEYARRWARWAGSRLQGCPRSGVSDALRAGEGAGLG